MAPTPGITSNNSTRRTLDPIDPQERKAAQPQAKDAVSTLADDIASQPVNTPTDQTAADTRRAIRFDPTTNQLITRINGQVPTATNNDGTVTITGTAEADRIRVEQEEDQIRAYYTDANDEE